MFLTNFATSRLSHTGFFLTYLSLLKYLINISNFTPRFISVYIFYDLYSFCIFLSAILFLSPPYSTMLSAILFIPLLIAVRVSTFHLPTSSSVCLSIRSPPSSFQTASQEFASCNNTSLPTILSSIFIRPRTPLHPSSLTGHLSIISC